MTGLPWKGWTETCELRPFAKKQAAREDEGQKI